MYHMEKTTTVYDLRYHSPEIEARLTKGEEIIVHKRRKVIARLVPVGPDARTYPDFSALRRGIFGKKKARKTGTEIVSEGRDRY